MVIEILIKIPSGMHDTARNCMLKPEMKQSSKREQSEGTRNALIMTGARLFASKGYHAVSVRELTSEAGVNLATVSYHFGGKAGLYEAIFRYIITRHDEITPSAEEVRKNGPPVRTHRKENAKWSTGMSPPLFTA